MNEKGSLYGKHALITGGGTGLGFGIAKAMAEVGARVTIVGRREAVLKDAVTSIGDTAGYEIADIADLATIPEIVRRVEARAPVDILINNAGAHHKAPTLETADADMARVIGINLFGSFGLTREVARGMAAREGGSVVMITSMAAILGLPQVASYTSSKSALQGLTRQLAVEFGGMGIRVNAVAPGFIETDMNRGIFEKDPERLERILARTPLGGLGEPSDVAGAVVYLSSPAARFVTGVCLPVDGGLSIGF